MYKYRVIVADDEYDIREGLAELFQNEIENVEVMGAFKTGKQVIDFLEENRVDLVVTDICMPEADGLEVAKYIKEKHLETDVVIITAHRDFEYARKAVYYGVSGFETKPINFDSLIETVLRLKQAKEENQISKTQQINTLKFIEERAELCRKLYSYVSGKTRFSSVEKQLTDIYPDIDEKPCAMIKFTVEGDAQLIGTQNSWRYMCEISNVFYDTYCLEENKKACLMLMFFKENGKMDNDACAKQFCEDTVEIVKKAYEVAIKYEIEYYAGIKKIASQMMNETVKIYTEYLYDNNYPAIQDLLHTVQSIYDLEWFKNFAIELMTRFKETIDFDSSSYEEKCHSFTEKSQIVTMLDEVNKVISNNSANKIYQIKDYVSRHYTEDISLVAVSNAFGLNPTYFSRFFKKESGEGYSEYISRFKIEMAKELLVRSNKTIQEISYMLGYNGLGYFNKVFKSSTGYTLKQYRSKRQKEEKE